MYKKVAGKPPLIDVSYDEPTNGEGRPFMPLNSPWRHTGLATASLDRFYVLTTPALSSGRSSG